MKRAYGAWPVVVLALVLDVGVFVSPLPLSTSGVAFAEVWLWHAISCAILAASTFHFLPLRYRQKPLWTWLLMFDFAFIAPVVGPIGILVVARSTLHHKRVGAAYAQPRALDLPEYDIGTRDPQRVGQGAIRSRLGLNVPAGMRMKSLLTLQAVPSRVANPIREELLGDAADDVRLVAFGMLEAEEKRLTVHIHREQKNLELDLSKRARFDCLVHLAELHWELVYSALVQGELRRHILGEARAYIDAALALGETRESGIMLLKGQILLAQGDVALAEAALREALALGHSEMSVLPFLAELAFRRRDFGQVRSYMQYLYQHYPASRGMPIVDFWTAHDRVLSNRDQLAIHHL